MLDRVRESLREPARGALRALARGGGLVGDAEPEDLRATALVIEADQRVDEQPHGIGQREIVGAGEAVPEARRGRYGAAGGTRSRNRIAASCAQRAAGERRP